MDNVHPSIIFSEKDLSVSEADFPHESGILKTTSFIFDRRIFEHIGIESENSVDAYSKNSEDNFKHLKSNNLNESKQFNKEKKEQRKLRRRELGRSFSVSSIEPENIPFKTPEKKDKSKNLSLSEGAAFSNSHKLRFSDKGLIQPMSARDPLNTLTYRKATSLNLDHLKFIEEGKENHFNDKFRKKLKKILESHESELPLISTAIEIENKAQQFFENEIIKEIKAGFKLKRTTSVDLVKSELRRTQIALSKLQKSMILVQDIVLRIEFLQISAFNLLKKHNSKSKWSQEFFNDLDHLISSYRYGHDEINPLKTFTYLIEKQTKDQKISEILTLSLKVKKKEFEQIISCLNKWADLKTIYVLAPRVGEIDHQYIKESLDLSTDHVADQEHEWFESLDSENSLSAIQVEDILSDLNLERLMKYKQITVNDTIIPLNGFKGDRKSYQTQFFSNLLYAIYKSGFDLETDKIESAAQALVLVHIEAICKKIEHGLSQYQIDWELIEKTLSDYPAIPVSKLKKNFNASTNLDSVGQIIINLTIPCINILKLLVRPCWLKADLCIRCLFTDLFPSHDQKSSLNPYQTAYESHIASHIIIKNHQDYSVTQIKRYETYPVNQDHLDYANTTFEWTVGPYRDEKKGISCWKGILKIPHVEIDEKTPHNIKVKILKTLNNPNIVDYVTNSLDGNPTIITNFR